MEIDPDASAGDPNRFESNGESFILKDTLYDGSTEILGPSYLFLVIYKSTTIFLPNRSNRFELLLVDVGYVYPVGWRDLYIC